MAKYLGAIRIHTANLLGLRGEILVNDARVAVCWEGAAEDREQVVTKRMMVARLCPVPLADRLLTLAIDPGHVRMAQKMDVVAVRHGCAALRQRL